MKKLLIVFIVLLFFGGCCEAGRNFSGGFRNNHRGQRNDSFNSWYFNPANPLSPLSPMNPSSPIYPFPSR